MYCQFAVVGRRLLPVVYPLVVDAVVGLCLVPVLANLDPSLCRRTVMRLGGCEVDRLIGSEVERVVVDFVCGVSSFVLRSCFRFTGTWCLLSS